MKRLFSFVVLMGYCGIVLAQDSTAVAFAQQAGTIAGVVHACGQDVSVLASRTNEVIAVMALNKVDQDSALAAYQAAFQKGLASQSTPHKMGCDKVVQDFRSLPILQPDYKQTVLAVIAGQAGGAAAPAAPVPVVPGTPATPAGTAPGAAPGGVPNAGGSAQIVPGSPAPQGVPGGSASAIVPAQTSSGATSAAVMPPPVMGVPPAPAGQPVSPVVPGSPPPPTPINPAQPGPAAAVMGMPQGSSSSVTLPSAPVTTPPPVRNPVLENNPVYREGDWADRNPTLHNNPVYHENPANVTNAAAPVILAPGQVPGQMPPAMPPPPKPGQPVQQR